MRSRGTVLTALCLGALVTVIVRVPGHHGRTTTGLAASPAPAAEPVDGRAPAAQTRDGLAVTAWLALVGGAVTVASRLAYEDYYRPLGVTLDQVGLGTPRLIALAAVLVLTLSGIVGLSIAAVVTASAVDGWWGHAIALVATPAIAAAAVLGLAHAPYVTVVLAVPLGLAALIAPWLPLPRRWERRGRMATVPLCVVAVAAMAVTWWRVDHNARASALALTRGAPGSHSLAEALLDVAAEPVCLRPMGQASVPVPEAVILLGTAQGVHVVLVPGAKAMLVPVGAVMVTSGHFASGTRRPVCS